MRGTWFADIDGDGLADAIAVNDDYIWFRRSNGCNGYRPTESLTATPSLTDLRGIFFADIDGDKKADTIFVRAKSTWVRRTGDGAIYNFTYARYPADASFVWGYGNFFADVNGDGKADDIAVNYSGIEVRLSDGTYAAPATTWLNVPFIGTRGIYFADVDGDKRADAISVGADGITVRLSKPAHQDILTGLPVAEGFGPAEAMDYFADSGRAPLQTLIASALIAPALIMWLAPTPFRSATTAYGSGIRGRQARSSFASLNIKNTEC